VNFVGCVVNFLPDSAISEKHTFDIIRAVCLDKYCVLRTNQMYFLSKFIPINILYVFRIDLTVRRRGPVYCTCSLLHLSFRHCRYGQGGALIPDRVSSQST
jgi:hypothetical protein